REIQSKAATTSSVRYRETASDRLPEQRLSAAGRHPGGSSWGRVYRRRQQKRKQPGQPVAPLDRWLILTDSRSPSIEHTFYTVLGPALPSPQWIRCCRPSGSTSACTHRVGGGRPMAGGSVASALQRVQVAPASTLGERLDAPCGLPPFPVAEPLAPLLPGGRLRRGSVIAVHGSLSLLLALLAADTAQGAWVAVIDAADIGVLAAAE